MKKSESIANLAQALCDFQGEITNPKNSADNPFFKSKYAPLSEVINTIRPILAKYGLSVLQAPSGDGASITITTLLMHSSGEWLEPDPLTLRADKPTAQGAGSAITYGRRYGLSAILGIASEEDDDGNSATTSTGKAETKPEPLRQVKPTTTQPHSDKDEPANLEGFFTAALAIGYSKLQVLKEAGVISVDKWTQAKLTELYRDLKTKSLVEKVGN